MLWKYFFKVIFMGIKTHNVPTLVSLYSITNYLFKFLNYYKQSQQEYTYSKNNDISLCDGLLRVN